MLVSATIGWLVAATILGWGRKRRASLVAAALFLALASDLFLPRDASPGQSIARAFISGAQRLEFAVQRASYDAVVEKAPKTDVPRLIRVSHRDVSGMCCGTPLFEEIWFDESDAFAHPDAAVRDGRLQSSHPWRPNQTRRSLYQVRPLGGHYYFLDVRY
jgi:hypothetical protein